MDIIAPHVSWLASILAQLAQPALKASVGVVAPGASPSMNLGLKVLLEPTAGGVIFRAASNTAATIYPVYASAKAIESKDSKDDVQWLTYWTLYGSFIMAEHVADKALSRIPYYYHAKFAALLWLQLPQTQGATYLYTRFYKPALARFGPPIDAVLDRVHSLMALVYATYRMQIEASLALALTARQQAGAVLTWLLAGPAANGDKEPPKEEPTKANAA